MDGRHGGEVEDDVCAHGEEDPAFAADDLVEDLCHGLHHGRGEFVGYIACCVCQNDGVQPPADPSEAQGEGNGPGGFDCGIFDFFSDMRSCVVILLKSEELDSLILDGEAIECKELEC